jgi:pyruvate dehydrogenase E2 component (dihydrolipoamide acetyltransferase)
MTCTLSIDHRALDGVIGARWLAEFKRLIEHPLAMLL